MKSTGILVKAKQNRKRNIKALNRQQSTICGKNDKI